MVARLHPGPLCCFLCPLFPFFTFVFLAGRRHMWALPKDTDKTRRAHRPCFFLWRGPLAAAVAWRGKPLLSHSALVLISATMFKLASSNALFSTTHVLGLHGGRKLVFGDLGMSKRNPQPSSHQSVTAQAHTAARLIEALQSL